MDMGIHSEYDHLLQSQIVELSIVHDPVMQYIYEGMHNHTHSSL